MDLVEYKCVRQLLDNDEKRKSMWVSEIARLRFGNRVVVGVYDRHNGPDGQLKMMDSLQEVSAGNAPQHGVLLICRSQLEFHIAVRGSSVAGAMTFRDPDTGKFEKDFSEIALMSAVKQNADVGASPYCCRVGIDIQHDDAVTCEAETVVGEVSLVSVRQMNEGEDHIGYRITLRS